MNKPDETTTHGNLIAQVEGMRKDTSDRYIHFDIRKSYEIYNHAIDDFIDLLKKWSIPPGTLQWLNDIAYEGNEEDDKHIAIIKAALGVK